MAPKASKTGSKKTAAKKTGPTVAAAMKRANALEARTAHLTTCHQALAGLIRELEPTMPSEATDEAMAYLAAVDALE